MTDIVICIPVYSKLLDYISIHFLIVYHLIDLTKSLDSLNVMYFVMKIFGGNVAKNSSFCFHTIIEFGSLKERISLRNTFLYARFLHSTFAAVECVAGVSVTWNVLSWSGGHEFKPQLGWTWGAWYFCPKSYLNQTYIWYKTIECIHSMT